MEGELGEALQGLTREHPCLVTAARTPGPNRAAGRNAQY